jgi:acetyl-CoA C-acetyltransferase
MPDIVILAATRTPIGAFQGSLASAPAAQLGGAAIKSAVARAGVAAADVTDVLMGNVLQAGQGQAPARQAALRAGLTPAARAVTIHKVCGSGLQAVMQATHALQRRHGPDHGGGRHGEHVAGALSPAQGARRFPARPPAGARLGCHRRVVGSL